MKRRKGRKAVSTTFSDMLLLGITLATALSFYGWLMPWMAHLQREAQLQIMEEITMFKVQPDRIEIVIRNIGAYPATIDVIRVFTSSGGELGELNLTSDNTISVKESRTFTFFFPEGKTWRPSMPYHIEAVTDGGFKVMCTKYSPSERR